MIYKFHYGYIKNKYGNNSRLIFTDADSLIYDIKTDDGYESFSKNRKMFEISNYSTKSKYYYDSNKLVLGKMKGETARVAIKECVGSKPNMYQFLVDDNSKHKKAKDMNKIVVATISHGKQKYLLLNQK